MILIRFKGITHPHRLTTSQPHNLTNNLYIMFSAIFPIDNKYVVFSSTADIFRDIDGHCGVDSLDCKLEYMKKSLQEKSITVDHIITNESLLFLYFSTFGTFNIFSDVSVNNCVIELKSLGPKVVLRSFAYRTKSRYTRRNIQPAQ